MVLQFPFFNTLVNMGMEPFVVLAKGISKKPKMSRTMRKKIEKSPSFLKLSNLKGVLQRKICSYELLADGIVKTECFSSPNICFS